ncbi:MAG: hypothetical protein EZS28_045355, partial [Streblomastix strix]
GQCSIRFRPNPLVGIPQAQVPRLARLVAVRLVNLKRKNEKCAMKKQQQYEEQHFTFSKGSGPYTSLVSNKREVYGPDPFENVKCCSSYYYCFFIAHFSFFRFKLTSLTATSLARRGT